MATTGCFGISENYQKLIKAQLAKADKEWVDVIQIQQGVCHTHQCKYDLNVCDFCGATCNWWQERKKEIGL